MKKMIIGSLLLSTLIFGAGVQSQNVEAAEATSTQQNCVVNGMAQVNLAREKVNHLFYDLGYTHTAALNLDVTFFDLLAAQKEVSKLQMSSLFNPKIKQIYKEIKLLMDSANKMFYSGTPEVFKMATELIHGFYTDKTLSTVKENISSEDLNVAFELLKDTEVYGTAYMNAHNGDDKYLEMHYELQDLVMNCL